LLPRSAWRTIELDLPTRKYRTPRVFEQKVSLAGATFSQLFIQDLGHDEPTILLCNQHRLSAKKLITRYAQRMLIENALSDAVRFFHLDALSSAVGLKIDSIWSFSSSPVVSIVYSPKPCAVIPMLKLAPVLSRIAGTYPRAPPGPDGHWEGPDMTGDIVQTRQPGPSDRN